MRFDKWNVRWLRQGSAALALGALFLGLFLLGQGSARASIPVVPILGTSENGGVFHGVDLTAKKVVVLNPENIDIADVPERKMLGLMGRFKGIDSAGIFVGFSEWSRWKTLVKRAARSFAFIKNWCLAGRLSEADFEIDLFQDAGAATVIFNDEVDGRFVSVPYRLKRTAKHYSSLHIAGSSLATSYSEPSDDHQAGRKINQGNIGIFGLLTKLRELQVFEVTGIAIVVGTIGLILFQWEGVPSVIGGVLMVCGFVIGAYGPFLVPRF